MADNQENKLSQEDIKALMENPDAESKIQVIEKISHHYNSKEFSGEQVSLAEDIFKLLLRQAEVEVRKALAENIMHSRSVPRDVILPLARDLEEVALPVLEFSEVITDDDLVELVQSTEQISRHLAISKRKEVPEKVSAALIDKGNEQVVHSLIENEGAEISEVSYNKAVDTFRESELIVDSMITRGSLPTSVLERMTVKVSEALQKKLEEKYSHSFKDINTFFRESGQIAALKFMSKQKIDEELMELVDDLEESGDLVDYLHPVHGKLTQLLDGLEQIGRMTPLSALTMGHRALFEISMSRMTGVPYSNVRKLVSDPDAGLKALYNRAKLPPKMFEAVQLIIIAIRDIDREAKKDSTKKAREDLFALMRRITDDAKGKDVPNLSHFLSIISEHTEETLGEW